METRNIVRLLVLVPLSTYLLYCCYHFLTKEAYPTYRDCGKIISKSTDEVAIKHGTSTELYLNVQFRKSGFRSINCSPTTYFSMKVGEIVCFSLPEEKSGWYVTSNIIGIIVIAIIAIVLISALVGYLLPDD